MKEENIMLELKVFKWFLYGNAFVKYVSAILT